MIGGLDFYSSMTTTQTKSADEDHTIWTKALKQDPTLRLFRLRGTRIMKSWNIYSSMTTPISKPRLLIKTMRYG